MTFVLGATADLVAFAEERKAVQDRHEKDLIGSAKYALRHWTKGTHWADALIDRASRLLRQQYHADTGKWTSPRLRAAQKAFATELREALSKVDTKPDPDRIDASAATIASSFATNATNLAARLAAEDSDTPNTDMVKVWVAMDDDKVRPTHVEADGQSVPLGEKFKVGESKMDRPGDLSAPISEWANCRCLLAFVVDSKAVAASLLASTDPTGGDMATDDTLDDAPEAPPEPIDIANDPVPFWGVLAPEDTLSGDGRKFAANSLRSRPLPLPLAYQRVNQPGHDGSVKVGNIERTWRLDGLVYGSGHFLTSVPEADEQVAIMVESGGRTGVSVDADDGAAEMSTRDGRRLEDIMEAMEPGDEVEFDMDDLITVFTTARIAGATTCNIPAFHQAFLALGDVPEEFATGEELAIEARDDALVAGVTSKPGTEDGPGWITHPIDTDRLRDWVVRDPKGIFKWGIPGDFNRCRAWATQYIKPQYISGYCANRHYDALGFWPGRPTSADTIAASLTRRESLIAAGGQMAPALTLTEPVDLYKPPAEWFSDPGLVGASPITITDEGRFFGHLAKWGSCHIGFDGVCMEPPHSQQNYAQFLTKYVVADNGDTIPVGVLTMDTGHADLRAGARPAAAHYDNTGTMTALVNVGEDDYGIWVAGSIAPGTPPEKVFKMRASVLSGDWRDVAGNLELVAALHVNVGGFPIERTAVAASGGHQTALVAAGLVLTAGGEPVNTTVEEIVEKTIAALDAKAAIKARAQALKDQRAAENRARVEAIAASRTN